MPFTTLIVAQSIDGFITRHDKAGTQFCSESDQTFFFKALQQFDCQIMGRATYELSREKIRDALGKKRLRKIITRNPERWASEAVAGSLEFTNASPKNLVDELKARDCASCALLGGTQTYSAFLQADCVDEIWITLEPTIFGSGKKLAEGQLDTAFTLLSAEQLSPNTILLKYQKKRSKDPQFSSTT